MSEGLMSECGLEFLWNQSDYSLLIKGNVGVPIKLLFEAEGMKVTAEVSLVSVWKSLIFQGSRPHLFFITDEKW